MLFRPTAAQSAPLENEYWPLLLGTETGLYGLDPLGVLTRLWSGGEVRKILRMETPDRPWGAEWLLLSDQGILFSRNLRNWELRNEGLPRRTIKVYENGGKSFIPGIQEIKDLEVDPQNPNTLVCAVKNAVYLSRDGGQSWENLGMPAYRTNGIKAVAAATLPRTQAGEAGGELVVFLSHSTYGVYYYLPGRKDAKWIDISQGLEKLETTGNSDEVSDIAVSLKSPDGTGVPLPEIYAIQSFRGRLYRLDWGGKRFLPLWSDESDFCALDSLSPGRESLRFIKQGEVLEIGLPREGSPRVRERRDLADFIRSVPKNLNLELSCALFWEDLNRRGEYISLSELWLLDPPESVRNRLAASGAGREGIYLPVNRALESRTLKPYLDLMEKRNLNMLVIDMKDDYGRLRFSPQTPLIASRGRVFNPVDIDALLKEMKDRGIYIAARIVVFKDPELARKEGGRFAVWDSRKNKPWAGYYDVKRKKGSGEKEDSPLETEILPADDPEDEIVRTYYDEKWVDPYSEEVWEYTAALAVELHRRGFDEIQFDYIRFPTDGVNLGDARYRWQEAGMDMDSAIVSFLRHVRSRLDAPISVDIYGANGWYRTGARTGQEVELLAPWVDVICPMYYPSHFEQDFLAQNPPELRPYRIYYLGTQRTGIIARGKVIVRPYVQAFYLNVSYDRKYYNLDYVRLETQGVRDAGRPGLTYWNNSGRYGDIPIPAAAVSGDGIIID